jgi:hypothetical protein
MKGTTSPKKVSKRNTIIAILVVITVLLVYKVIQDLYYGENYCEKQAQQIVGQNWTKKIPATENDKQQWSGIIESDGTIYWGIHEVLQCEKSHKAFIFF